MSASNYLAVREDWLSLSQEEVLEPELKIVDAHHHFYDRPGWHYLQEQYIADARSGHDVRASVYMQAMTRYRLDGPDVLKPVGETAFVVESTGATARDVPQVALGIVGHADLRAGAGVREVLDAHIDAGEGRFRGIRHLATWDADSTLVNPLSAAPRGLLLDRNYREGFAQLAPLGLSYDAWVFFPQLLELFDLAKAFPDTTIVINHCGGIVRIGAYQERGPEVFKLWAQSMRQLAQLPNVFVKLGGLGMRINGFDFEKGDVPPGSETLAQAWRPWIELCIESFGAHRCMFESNFPVDKGSYSYRTLWNAFKRLTKKVSNQERQDLFEGTASHVYRLN